SHERTWDVESEGEDFQSRFDKTTAQAEQMKEGYYASYEHLRSPSNPRERSIGMQKEKREYSRGRHRGVGSPGGIRQAEVGGCAVSLSFAIGRKRWSGQRGSAAGAPRCIRGVRQFSQGTN